VYVTSQESERPDSGEDPFRRGGRRAGAGGAYFAGLRNCTRAAGKVHFGYLPPPFCRTGFQPVPDRLETCPTETRLVAVMPIRLAILAVVLFAVRLPAADPVDYVRDINPL
jgi:hypothetical protein